MKHEGVVNAIQFSPDGAFLLTASRDGSAAPLARRDPRGESACCAMTRSVRDAVFSDTGLEVITTAAGGSVRVWDVRGAFDEDERTQPRNVALNIESKLTIAEPSHGRVFTGGDDGAVRTWSARSSVLIGPPLRHPGPITEIVGVSRRIANRNRGGCHRDSPSTWRASGMCRSATPMTLTRCARLRRPWPATDSSVTAC